MAWSIWKGRNNQVWNNTSDSCQTVLERALHLITSWRNAQQLCSLTHVMQLVQQQTYWSKPRIGRYKCNIDASFSMPHNKVGVGMCIRDDKGQFVAARTEWIEPTEWRWKLEKPWVTPYSDAGLFSLATLSWLNSILSIGAKRPLELKDIPLVAPKDRAKANFKVLNSNREKMKAENTSTQPSLAWTLFKSFWKEAAINAIFAGVTTLVSYGGPFMISYFVDYLSGIETYPHEGYVLAGIFFIAKLVETFTTRQWYLGVDILGMHVRSALTAMVYQKGLRLLSLARQSHTSGENVNYMAIDVQRVGDYSWYLHDMWMLPLQIILALAILYKNAGITSIAWEDRYRIRLEEMRGVEFKWLRKALYSQAFITFMFWSSPIFVSAVTFATCILLGGKLTAGGVLSALATFRIPQEPLRNFPDLVSTMAQTKVSIDSLSWFLLEEELQKDATIVLPQGISNIAIEIKDSEFSWDLSSARPTLSEINMKVEKGMRVTVCGTVGSGKSSFLSCILGEIPKLSGEVSVCGSSAYVSQSAWIQSGTIEENILFVSPKDKAKYKNVIHACSLKKDLELFSHGEKTIIGDRATDLILVLKEGCIIQAGKYDDLLQAGTDFKALVSAHHEAIEAMDIPSHSSEDSDENLTLEASVMTSKKSMCSANDIDSLTKEMQEGPSSSDQKTTKEKKKTKRSRKKQLVQEEERVRGRVSMKVYLSYMAAAYKGLLIPLIIIAQALFQFLQIASNWWLAWDNPQTEGDEPKVTPMVLLLVYMALAFGSSSWFIFVRTVLVATFGLAAAQKLFLKMLRCVLLHQCISLTLHQLEGS
ncbi:unnamed protein product [Trifolium pratense]|uniref:Uncharacterized protein n=1 Tax=Trifolium pratense TaxID=57577 RepID=A0ACB0JU99_TRIPR|nr:unnamed protein product [Trifolium pratense]